MSHRRISVAKHTIARTGRTGELNCCNYEQVAAGRRGLHAADGCNRPVVVAVCNERESRENNKTHRAPCARANSRGRKPASGKTAKLTDCGQFVFNYADRRAEGWKKGRGRVVW